MKKINWMLLTLCSLIFLDFADLKAADVYDISEYFPIDVGNKWEYQAYRTTDEFGQGTVYSVESKTSLNGKEVYLFYVDYDSPGEFISYYSLDDDGIYLHKMADKNVKTVFSSPVRAFPKKIKYAEEYTSNAPVKFYDAQDKLIDEGTITIKVKMEGLEDVDISAGSFKDCLKIYYTFTKKTATTLYFSYQTMWLAKDIGDVKEQVFAKEKQNDTEIGRDYVEMELISAVVKGNKIGN